MSLLRSLLALTVPGLLFAAALTLKTVAPLPGAWQPLLAMFPAVAAVFAALLGWRFNRTRVLWTIALLLIVERSLSLSSPQPGDFILKLSAVLVPLNLLLYAWWSERGLLTLHGLLRGLFLLAQAGGAFWLYQWRGAEAASWLARPFVHLPFLSGRPLTQAAMITMLVALVGLLVRFFKRPEPLEGGFSWALAAIIAGFCWPADFAFWSGVAVLILAVAIVEGSFSMAFHDELTGLPGRRAMNEFLLKVGRRYTVAMVDVDHFKKVNDTHGHDVGDQVLRMVATCLRRVGGSGRAYRYGGEEFAVIFPNKELERALPHLEELRETIACTGFTLRGRRRPKNKPEKAVSRKSGTTRLNVTVSIGTASRDERNATPQQLIKAADQALYKAKKGGRNRVCTA